MTARINLRQRQEILRTYFPPRRDRRQLAERFVVLLAVSVVVATLGLWRDSAAVVIAAMLVAPLLLPIMALSLAVVMGWLRLQLMIMALLIVSSAFACLIGYLVIAAFQPPQHIELSGEILARTEPTFEDLLVAACVGFIAAFAHLRREGAGAVQGAAIAVALVPPLAAASILFYEHRITEALNALLLFATNVATVVLVASLTFLSMGFRSGDKRAGTTGLTLGSAAAVLVVVLIVAIPLLERTVTIIVELQEESIAANTLRQEFSDLDILVERIEIDDDVLYVDLWTRLPLDRFLERDMGASLRQLTANEEMTKLQKMISVALQRPMTIDVDLGVGARQLVAPQ